MRFSWIHLENVRIRYNTITFSLYRPLKQVCMIGVYGDVLWGLYRSHRMSQIAQFMLHRQNHQPVSKQHIYDDSF